MTINTGRTARITIDLALPEGVVVDDRLVNALENLAAVMVVQAEDGLYDGGSPDVEVCTDTHGDEIASEFVTEFEHTFSAVEMVTLDQAGSISRQFFIETGRYLSAEEAHAAEAGA